MRRIQLLQRGHRRQIVHFLVVDLGQVNRKLLKLRQDSDKVLSLKEGALGVSDRRTKRARPRPVTAD